MIRSTVLATSAILLCATSSYATVTIETTSQPTPGLPDYLTYTYTAVSTEPIVVFDFAGNGNSDPATGKGFFGAMNQVNPLGLSTVFADNNAAFPLVGANVLQDSQFLVKTTDVVAAFNGFENANLLQGVWAWSPPSSPGNTFPFAQIVAPANSPNPIHYRGEIVTTNSNGVSTLFRVDDSHTAATNQPPVVTDKTIGALTNDLITHTFGASDPDDDSRSLSWSDFRFTGPGAALQPTFDPIKHIFNWNTAGSQPGAYQATVRATDPYGAFDDGTLTINLTSGANLPPVVTDSTIGAVASDLISYRFQASDPDDPSASLLWSNFRFTGPGAALQPTFDPISHDFSWNTAGSQAGIYQATVRSTDPHGAFDDGTLTINLTSDLPPLPPGFFTVSATPVPTPGLPGYQTWILTATAGAGEKIVGFDFVGDGTSKGFFGSMNQVNPADVPTVFQDNNAFFPFVNADVLQGSQFKVTSSTGVHLGDAESGAKLQAAFNYSSAYIGLAAQRWDFAQLVIPIFSSGAVQYVGTFTVSNNGVYRLVQVAGTINGPFIPEPATFALAGIAMLCMIGFIRRR
jgi:PEP-CTERM motif